MCYISVILKKNESLAKEFRVRLKEADLFSFETPYYVIIEENDVTITFSYSYSENSVRTDEIIISDLKIHYGEKTGRVFKVEMAHTKALDIDLFSKQIDEKLATLNWSDLKVSNLRFGLIVFQAVFLYVQNDENEGQSL